METQSAPRPLRALRAERLLSMRGLAHAAGVALSTVYLIEAGRSTPRPSVMRRIAAALGADAHPIAEFRRAIHVRAGRAGAGRHRAPGQRPPAP